MKKIEILLIIFIIFFPTILFLKENKTNLKENWEKPKKEIKLEIKEEIINNDPEFTQVPVYSISLNRNDLYADIINHAKVPFLSSSRSTNAHESTHDINSTLRNELSPKAGDYNGFYISNGKGIIVKDPNFSIHKVPEFIPNSVRGYRYNLYLVQQARQWDEPTYIFDEWSSYINGGLVAVEDIKNGHKPEKFDAVSGAMEFSIYSVAVCMACEKYDPEFWKNNEQFKNFVNFQLNRAYNLYKDGYKNDNFIHNEVKIYKQLLTDQSTENMRNFIKLNFNNVWLEGEVADYIKSK